jgi:pyruvate ferredoxin oxidoreductase beta subunit
MPKRSDLKSILIIGAGPIIIGQACEFDYSGAQACKALREEGYKVILVNSNPATIMTDPATADVTYIEPITWQVVEKIIAKERPDAILPTMGGQTALNCALDLHKHGVLAKYGVEMIGANEHAIEKAEDRLKFKDAMTSIGLGSAKSGIAHSMEEAWAVQKSIQAEIGGSGFPMVIRPSFTLGGTGGGIAYNPEEFEEICKRGIDLSPTNELLIAANATGCLEVFSTPYPETSWQLPWIHSLFGNAAAVGSGIAAALKVKAIKAGVERSPTRVIAQGGDGGTTDIGFGCLSGMFERNDDVLYICYDNEAYMNTGVQRSSATPPAARTATTMAVGTHPGAEFGQGKNLPLIAMAHEIPYVATATVADLRDLEAKVEKAMSIHGARYLHILVPCPLGWGAASQDTIRLARLARETGLFPVFEAEHGEVTAVTKIRRHLPVEEYLRPQKRFAHLFASGSSGGQPEMIEKIQAEADRNIRRFKLLEETEA